MRFTRIPSCINLATNLLNVLVQAGATGKAADIIHHVPGIASSAWIQRPPIGIPRQSEQFAERCDDILKRVAFRFTLVLIARKPGGPADSIAGGVENASGAFDVEIVVQSDQDIHHRQGIDNEHQAVCIAKVVGRITIGQ